jgi:hypothetical protein
MLEGIATLTARRVFSNAKPQPECDVTGRLVNLPRSHKFPGAMSGNSNTHHAGVNRGPRRCVLERTAQWIFW